jgi:hypothetical protein
VNSWSLNLSIADDYSSLQFEGAVKVIVVARQRCHGSDSAASCSFIETDRRFRYAYCVHQHGNERWWWVSKLNVGSVSASLQDATCQSHFRACLWIPRGDSQRCPLCWEHWALARPHNFSQPTGPSSSWCLQILGSLAATPPKCITSSRLNCEMKYSL